MEKPNITEGEWDLLAEQKENSNHYFHITAKSEDGWTKVVSWEYEDHPVPECIERWYADAKAISAVPDMLEALIEARAFIEAMASPFLDNEQELKRQVDEALKKAGVTINEKAE